MSYMKINIPKVTIKENYTRFWHNGYRFFFMDFYRNHCTSTCIVQNSNTQPQRCQTYEIAHTSSTTKTIRHLTLIFFALHILRFVTYTAGIYLRVLTLNTSVINSNSFWIWICQFFQKKIKTKNKQNVFTHCCFSFRKVIIHLSLPSVCIFWTRPLWPCLYLFYWF